MGRKIPAKKHRGVKDPLVQHARRMQSIKDKINTPPTDPDEQPVPRSLTRLFALKDKTKVTKKKLRKQYLPSKESIQKGVGDNPISKLKKFPGESGRGFSLRINSAVRALHGPIDQDEYPQDLEEKGDAKGERMFDQRERRKRKNKGKQNDEEPKLSRNQKLALKRKAKKEKAVEEEETLSKEVVYEHVGFGDITHAPPNLTVRPKMRGQDSAAVGAPRPGRKDLLLSSMLSGNTKMDLVNAADLARREQARLDVVAAYRELKKQNRQQIKTKKKK